MRYNILGFNQALAVEYNLDLIDLLLLDYIIRANGNPKMLHTIKDDISYVWLKHSKLSEDLPILNISDGTLKNRLSKLKKDNFIMTVIVANKKGQGSMSYYSITEKTTSLISDVVNETTSLKNDVVDRPVHSKMTSNNIDNNKKDINNNSKELLNEQSEYESHMYSKDDFLGSSKKKTTKGKNLFSKCVDEIDKFTDLDDLRDSLINYLTFRLSVKEKPLYGVNQWKAMLNKLDKAVEECKREYIDVVNNSLDKGWLNFYPIQSSKPIKKDVFSEYGEVTCERKDEKYVDRNF